MRLSSVTTFIIHIFFCNSIMLIRDPGQVKLEPNPDKRWE